MEHYAFHSNETEKYYVQDNSAALAIQTKFRMYIKRKEFLKMRRGNLGVIQLPLRYRHSTGHIPHTKTSSWGTKPNWKEEICSSTMSKRHSSRRYSEGTIPGSMGRRRTSMTKPNKTSTTITEEKTSSKNSKERIKSLKNSWMSMERGRESKMNRESYTLPNHSSTT